MQSDAAFVSELRTKVERYMRAVDSWETAYAKFYRLRTKHQVSSDLMDVQHEYVAARKELLEVLPRAVRLCRKFELRDPWAGLQRVELGDNAPQTAGGASAIGQGERTAVIKCLVDLEAAVALNSGGGDAGGGKNEAPKGLLSRVLDFFF